MDDTDQVAREDDDQIDEQYPRARDLRSREGNHEAAGQEREPRGVQPEGREWHEDHGGVEGVQRREEVQQARERGVDGQQLGEHELEQGVGVGVQVLAQHGEEGLRGEKQER